MSKKGFTYTLQIDAEINDLIAKTNQVKKSMQSIMDAGKAPGAEKVFTSIEKAIERLQTKASQPIESVAAFQNLQKDAAAVGASLGKLGTIIENLGNMGVADKLDLLPPNLKKQIEDASSALTAFSKATAQAEQKTQDLADAENQLAAAQKELKKAEGRAQDKKALVTAQQQLVDAAHAEADAIKAKIEALKKYQTTAAAYETAGGNKSAKGDSKANAGKGLEGLNLPGDRKAAVAAVPGLNPSDAQAVADAIARLNDEYRQASKAVTDTEATQRRYNSQLNDANTAASVASGKVTTLTNTVARLNAEFEKDKAKNVQVAYTQLRNEAGKLGVDLKNIPLDYTEQNFNELSTAMNQLVVNGISQVDAGLNVIQSEMGETATAAQNLGDHMNVASGEVVKLDTAVSNTMAFTERIKQFVGLQGGIQLARTAMRNAISTIKELDKAMTEMAVVTDLEVGDYWGQLPRHTEDANKLGVAIKDVYEAETLYYQQGLKQNEVVAMSAQTLKMARVAGLSAEDATNKMTAALRGFNMELNETSAQRVADVYSELAAITASDVDEISSAMTKTASIAASAGMEFETTAAFLSQIIETTRESAETAGTALKTVIARFQELKKDPSEIGEVEGEIVDANKIETALRSVNVSLRDTRGQFRELDDVFLELSSKWDGLDTNTQRYIATIAAGSRQQSRFIAMMSDYSRTQELVTAANSSAGASNEQFEKTMDSLESKLNKLKNAWDSFTMGIMDSDLLKAGIDLLTDILTAINNITDAFGDFSGAAKIGLLISALYFGEKALNVFSKSIKEGASIFQAFGSVGTAAVNSASKSIETLNKKMIQSNQNAQKLSQMLKKGFTSEQTSAIAKYNKELEREKQLRASFNKIEQQKILMEKAGLNQTQEYITVQHKACNTEAMASAQTKERIAAQNALLVAMELTDDQQKEAIAISGMGISMDAAAILSSAGYTAAQITEEAAIEGVTEAEYAEKLAKEANTKSTGLAAVASFILTSAQTLQQQGLKALIKSWWGQLKAKFADIAATWGQVTANTALQVSMWPILAVTLLIVAAIAALVAIVWLVIAAFKAWKASTPEGKLKSAEEAADAAAEAAERTAQAYNDLVDAVENLSDQYNGLENLTRGTKEWKEAVKEVNAEVLDLIEKYPELAGFVENKNGVLTLDIESKEVQEAIGEYEKKAAQASAASYAAKINVNEKRAAVRANEVNANKHLQGVYVSTGDSGYYQDLTQGTLKAVSQAIASGDIFDEDGSGSMTEEISDWLASNGTAFEQMHADTFAAQLDKATEELREFGNELDTMDAQDQVMYTQMAQDAINALDTSKFTEAQLKQMDTAATADFSKSFNESSQAELEKAIDKEGKNGETFQKAKEEVAKNLYGEDATVSGNKITYIDENGEKQTEKLTDEEFKEQWAAIDATRNMTAAFEQLPKTINKITAQMSSEASKAFKAMYAGKEGSAMTNADINAAKEITEERMRAIWGTLSLEEQSAYGDFSTFWKQFSDSREIALEAQNKAAAASANAGIDVMEGITMEAAQSYAEQMRQIYLLNTDNAKELDASIRQVMSTLNETEKTSFITALNALDWNKVESLETLPETLEQLGFSIDTTNLIDQITEFANAVKTIDLTKLNETLPTLSKLSKDINTGEQGRIFSQESYDALVQMAPELAKNFQMDQDGQYVYLGSAMSDLTEAIKQNTQALLAEANEQLANKIKMAQVTQQQSVKQEGIELSFAQLTAGQGSEQTMRQALQNYQTNMTANNAKIIGIDNFSNEADVAKLSIDEMKTIFQQLTESANKLPEYMEDYDKNLGQSASLVYQGQNAATNAYGVKMGSTYKQSTSQQQKEFDARSATLMVQAASSGISSALIDKYAAKVAEYKVSNDTGLYKEVLSVQKELANATSYNNMRKGLQGVLETSKEVTDEYLKLASGDVVGKVNVANQALARFGIQVTKAADADMYIGLLEQLTQGNSNALNALVQAAQDQAGQAISGMSNAYSQGWGEDLSEEQVEFLNTMEAAQLGYWKRLEDGSTSFVWATVEELDSIAEAAGTAIEKWENPYTWLYNYNEEINRLIREREKAERAYNRALEDETATAETLINLSNQQLKTFQEEVAMQAQSVANAEKEIAKQFSENKDFSKYIQYDINTGGIVVDYAGLDTSGFNEDKMDDFEKFVSLIEENRDVIVDAEKRIEEIEDETKKINDRGKDEASDTLNVIKEGLIQSRQQEIDSLQTINDSIQEAQSALVDQIQKQIDEARQARENEKTEIEITDKEARLAYLMRDTSGGNANEIAALQQEIADAKQNYTDSLVDQQLQTLQDANEEAAEQRQQQIDIAQAQLDAYANSSQVWIDTKRILDDSLAQAKTSDNFSEAWMDTQAGKLSGISQGIDSLNPIEKDELMRELTTNAQLAAVFTTKGIADEAENTTNAVNNAKEAINTIKENAGNFGRFGATDLATGLGSITTELKNKPTEIASSITNAGKYTNLTTAMKNSIFSSPIDTRIVQNTEGEGEGVDEEAEKARKQHDAVQRAITAATSFTSGGITGAIGSNEWTEAQKAYKAAGGKGDFEEVVKKAIQDKDSSYSYGAHYNNSSRKIDTGTFPATNGQGGGYADKLNTVTWGLDDVKIHINGDTYDAKLSTETASDTIAKSIEQLYANEGLTPANGWIALYKDVPYVFKNKKWHKIDKDNGLSEVHTAMVNSLNGRFATGGLADFTGPAWLDGTKSKPEIVLNQTDSANFMQLRDILADILQGTTNISGTTEKSKGGDNYYDIEINVESINDDYDVEQLADKIRDMIYEDSIYRNVNSINRTR